LRDLKSLSFVYYIIKLKHFKYILACVPFDLCSKQLNLQPQKSIATTIITVIDSIMGSGKTNYMIDYINKTHHDALGLCFSDEPANAPRFLYVAPLLSEVERIRKACPDLDFRDPKPVAGKKLNHLSELVARGANICTTHVLFRHLTREIYEKLKARNYVLILDEVLDCVSIFDDLTRSDLKLLLNDRRILVDPKNKRLRWNHQDHSHYKGKFDTLRNLCDNGNLVLFRDTVIWEFPTDFLQCFDQVFVLTYLFQGSPMSAYLQAAGLDYETRTIVNRTLVLWPACSHEALRKGHLRDLITVYEGSANRWGDQQGRSNPFSVSQLEKLSKRSDPDLKGIKASDAPLALLLAACACRHVSSRQTGSIGPRFQVHPSRINREMPNRPYMRS
jgi:hypothetical protein